MKLGKIQKYLENIKINQAKMIKECAQYLCVLVRDIINKSILIGTWAKIYKKETIYPPDLIDNLRPIANLININKIQEKAIAEMVIEDMEANFGSI